MFQIEVCKKRDGNCISVFNRRTSYIKDDNEMARSRKYKNRQYITAFSINLLVVYRESANLSGYLTRRLSADSLQL